MQAKGKRKLSLGDPTGTQARYKHLVLYKIINFKTENMHSM
jgi:hypothetical protein